MRREFHQHLWLVRLGCTTGFERVADRPSLGYDADLEFRNKITFPDEAKVSINFTQEIAQLDLILAFNLSNFGTVSPVDQDAVQTYLNATKANVTALKVLLQATQTNLTDAQTELL